MFNDWGIPRLIHNKSNTLMIPNLWKNEGSPKSEQIFASILAI